MKQRKAYSIFKILLAVTLLGATFLAPISCNIFGEYNNPKDPKIAGSESYYSIIYKANGATSGTVPVDSNRYTTGATVTVLGNTGNLAKTGYSFAGWNTRADGMGTSYTAGSTFTMGSANVTLYAKWPSLGTNVAASTNGATATAISEGTYLGNTEYAYEAIDANKNTGWSSDGDMPAWLVVEFDQTYNIETVSVWWGSHRHNFTIKLSLNGTSWTTVKTGTSNNAEGDSPVYEVFTITPRDARYIRIDITSTSAPFSHIFQASVNEIEAYSQ